MDFEGGHKSSFVCDGVEHMRKKSDKVAFKKTEMVDLFSIVKISIDGRPRSNTRIEKQTRFLISTVSRNDVKSNPTGEPPTGRHRSKVVPKTRRDVFSRF